MKDKKGIGCGVLVALAPIFMLIAIFLTNSQNRDRTYTGNSIVLDDLKTDYQVILSSEAQAVVASDEYFLIGTRNGEFIWGVEQSDPLAPRFRSEGEMVSGTWIIFEGEPKIHLTGEELSAVVKLSMEEKTNNFLLRLLAGLVVWAGLSAGYILIVDPAPPRYT